MPLWTKLAAKTCAGAEPFLTELEKQFVPLSANPKKTAKLFNDARVAFKNYAHAIGKKPPGAANSFSVGREGFEFLIRERLGLPYSLPEAEALGHKLIARFREELKREAEKFGRKSAHEIIAEAAAKWTPSSDGLLAEYQRTTDEMEARFAEADLLTLPASERLNVMPVPDFLRHHFPTAAYQQPGPYEKNQTGIFWVNDLSLQQTDPAKNGAEIEQHFGLELTCAHEAYPGHHVQFVIQNRNPSKLRRHLAARDFLRGLDALVRKDVHRPRHHTPPRTRG